MKFDANAALALARRMDRVVSIRRGVVEEFDMQKSPPSDTILRAALLGPTGNLRAPALRRGRTLVVGFSEAEYRKRAKSRTRGRNQTLH